MSKKKLSPEAELEKLYQDYKAQFEDWKIKNREAYGTDAYIHYVKQFEIWEEDVEKRRISLRNKAEQERKAQLEAEKLQREKDEAAALAYAEEQSSYMAMHIQQRVIQDEHMAAAAARNVSSKQYNNYSSPQISNNRGIPTGSNSNTLPNHQQTTTTTQLSVESKTHGPTPANEFNSMANVMQQMLNFAMNAEKSKDSAKNKSSSTNAPPSTSNTSLVNTTTTTTTNSSLDSSNAPPPQLWGKDGTQFLPTDPMFLRWGFRAAPTNFAMAFQVPPPSAITEYWLTLKALKENQLIALANEHPPPPPPHLAIPHHHLQQQQQQPIPLNSFHSVHPIGVGDSLLSYNIPPPNLNIPPPQSFYRTA